MKDKVYSSSEITPYHNSFLWGYHNVDLAATRKIMPQFGIRGVPFIVIISPDGQILGSHTGLIKKEAFLAMIKTAQAKSPPVKASAPKPTPAATSKGSATKGSSSKSKPKTRRGSIFKN